MNIIIDVAVAEEFDFRTLTDLLHAYFKKPIHITAIEGKSILKPWVQGLGLRHQGVLVSAVRGCDSAPKQDASKALTRCYREVILESHCGDAKKAATFIEKVDAAELLNRFDAFRKNCDHYPIHYVLHMVHAAEIIGYYHPDGEVRAAWAFFYFKMCRTMHLNMETCDELDARLNATEEVFATQDRVDSNYNTQDSNCFEEGRQ